MTSRLYSLSVRYGTLSTNDTVNVSPLFESNTGGSIILYELPFIEGSIFKNGSGSVKIGASFASIGFETYLQRIVALLLTSLLTNPVSAYR